MHSPFVYVFVAGILIEEIIRAPRRYRNWLNQRTGMIVEHRVGALEQVLMRLNLFGTTLAPILYAFTNWFGFGAYALPAWTGVIGVLCLAVAIWLLVRAHADLGRNWSPTLEIVKEHRLVTEGIYGTIRHPIYAAVWLTVIAQALMIDNWFVGFAGIAVFLPVYLTRIPAEERMMIDRFGDAYRAYMERTGGIVPRWRRRGAARKASDH
jgi:protein-S-isoprenylcysteine O-methyltransferase Ste14